MLTRRNFIPKLAVGVMGGSALWPKTVFGDAVPAPGLPGRYEAPGDANPFVFTGRRQMQTFLAATDASAVAAKANLERRTRNALKDSDRYTTPFDGCSLDTYLHKLTYEQGSATVVAADLATYAYLSAQGQGYGDARLADQAKATAKQILLQWSKSGFRDNGKPRTRIEMFCDDKGDVNQGVKFGIGLQIGRGMPNWVYAQDMLLAVGAFDGGEKTQLYTFLAGLLSLLTAALDYRAKGSNLECNRYSNHVSVQLAAIIAIARLLGDRRALEDAAYGAGGGIVIPWTKQVVTTVYGPDAKVLACYPNGTSADFFQLPEVQAGEMMDRYRAHEAQTFGYPTFSLTYLMLGADVLQRSGFRPYGPIGGRPSPLRAALHYYGGYFERLMSANAAQVPADFDYPGHAQYAGKTISDANGATIEARDGLLLPFLLGQAAYPKDRSIDRVIAKAESFAPNYTAFGGVASLYFGALSRLDGSRRDENP